MYNIQNVFYNFIAQFINGLIDPLVLLEFSIIRDRFGTHYNRIIETVLYFIIKK